MYNIDIKSFTEDFIETEDEYIANNVIFYDKNNNKTIGHIHIPKVPYLSSYNINSDSDYTSDKKVLYTIYLEQDENDEKE